MGRSAHWQANDQREPQRLTDDPRRLPRPSRTRATLPSSYRNTVAASREDQPSRSPSSRETHARPIPQPAFHCLLPPSVPTPGPRSRMHSRPRPSSWSMATTAPETFDMRVGTEETTSDCKPLIDEYFEAARIVHTLKSNLDYSDIGGSCLRSGHLVQQARLYRLYQLMARVMSPVRASSATCQRYWKRLN
jgi:hypothetical protein